MSNELTRVTVLGPRFVDAMEYASRRHRAQRKKGGDVPYVAHLLGVVALVLEDGGSEREAIAALLHDAVEDTGASIKAIRKRFGRKVARIVAGCTDTTPAKGSSSKKARARKRSAKNWRKRRAHMLEHLRDPKTSVSVVRVKAADSLDNVRSMSADLRRSGPEVWQRFNAGAVDQLWYYRSVAVIVSTRLPGFLADELRVAVQDLERVSAWWFDVGDPQSSYR